MGSEPRDSASAGYAKRPRRRTSAPGSGSMIGRSNDVLPPRSQFGDPFPPLLKACYYEESQLSTGASHPRRWPRRGRDERGALGAQEREDREDREDAAMILCRGGQVELPEDARHVLLHCALRADEPLRDCL